jgi:hypothetical protein
MPHRLNDRLVGESEGHDLQLARPIVDMRRAPRTGNASHEQQRRCPPSSVTIGQHRAEPDRERRLGMVTNRSGGQRPGTGTVPMAIAHAGSYATPPSARDNGRRPRPRSDKPPNSSDTFLDRHLDAEVAGILHGPRSRHNAAVLMVTCCNRRIAQRPYVPRNLRTDAPCHRHAQITHSRYR